jgi:O-antigen polymerase
LLRKLTYLLLISVILLTPFIYSGNLYNGLISAKQLWFYGIMALLLFVSGIYILINRKPNSIKLNATDVTILIFYIYYLIRSAFTPFIILWYNTKFLNCSLLLLFYFIVKEFCKSTPSQGTETHSTKQSRSISSSVLIIRIITGFIILTGLSEALLGLLQLYGFKQSFHSGFNITGTFFNPAPYSLYLASVFPVALGVYLFSNISYPETVEFLKTGTRALIFHLKPFLRLGTNSVQPEVYKISIFELIIKYSGLITFIAILSVLPATMIRASWVAVTISGSILVTIRFRLYVKLSMFLNTGPKRILTLLILLVFIGSSVIGLYFLKKGSSTGKLLIWEVTTGKIAEKPLFGFGTGRFEASYNNWQSEFFSNHAEEMEGPKGIAAGNTKYCFNEFLEMASETGLTGMLLFLAVIASLFSGAPIGSARPNERQLRWRVGFEKTQTGPQEDVNQSTLAIFIPSLVSLLVCALISFPFYSLPTLILFFIFLAFISSLKPSLINIALSGAALKFLKYLKSVALLAGSIIIFSYSAGQYKDYFVWDGPVKLFQAGNYNESCKSFKSSYESLKFNGLLLQYYGKALYLTGNYPESIRIFERAKLYNSDEILYCSLGDSYKACKMYDRAEETYLFASCMVPHKLYPLYLLANLYEETGQRTKASDIAKRVLDKDVKVKSQATDEIKMKMKIIIEKGVTDHL